MTPSKKSPVRNPYLKQKRTPTGTNKEVINLSASPKAAGMTKKKTLPVNTPFRVTENVKSDVIVKKKKVNEVLSTSGNVFNNCVFHF